MMGKLKRILLTVLIPNTERREGEKMSTIKGWEKKKKRKLVKA